MNVELLYHTPDPERAVATAARLCYAPVGAAERMETLSEEKIEHVLGTIMESGHFSTLEHASYTFAIDGVSRAMTHQLVRHRLASFNQQSQRYVTFKETPEFIRPATVDEAGAATARSGRFARWLARCSSSSARPRRTSSSRRDRAACAACAPRAR